MKNKEYKVGLYSLPPYQPAYIHPAMAYIAGHLVTQIPDIRIHQEDLNTSSLEYFLGREVIVSMKDTNTYNDFPKFKETKRAIAQRIQKVTDGSLKVQRNSVEYVLNEDYKSRQGLLETVENKKNNIYYDFFKEKVLPQIESEGMNIVGLSISDQKQLVPAVVLASMIKEQFGETVKVVLGGNIITRNYDVFSRNEELNRKLFDYFDYLIHHEGESAFTKLVGVLREGQDISQVPKLVYKKDGEIRENLEFVVEDVNSLPAPNFDGFIQQENHWTPKPVIPYIIGRGCDWSACSFCDIPAGYDGSRRRIEAETDKKFKIIGNGDGKRRNQNLDKVISELKELSQKYQTKYFSFSDEELAGDLLRSFVDKVLEERLDIEWECFGRIENLYLDRDFCEKLRKAGCRFIQFGIESASQTVLNINKKGYQFQSAKDVLKNTYEAGIMNHAFILTGLPGDTLIESSKLIKFLQESGQYLTTIKPISYKVSKWSPIALNPERFGVRLDKGNTPDLEQRINVQKDSGMISRHKAMAFTKLLELWIAKNHKVNPATSEYMYTQKLFLSRDKLENFGRSVDYQVNFSQKDSEAIAKIYNGLVEEIKLRVHSGKISREKRQRFSRLYNQLGSEDSNKTFDRVIKLANEVITI